jgi:hypothetical protein
MGIFEEVMHEQQPVAERVTLNPRQAFAALVVGAFTDDGHVAPEEAVRVNEIFNSTSCSDILRRSRCRRFSPPVAARARALRRPAYRRDGE